jgi:hypothetical protein
MSRTTRLAWLPLVAAAATGCSDPVRPVASQTAVSQPPRAALTSTAPQTITLVSGAGAVGSPDPATGFSYTRDGTYSAASIVAASPFYSIIPGSRYVSNAPNSVGPVSGSVWYRATFALPAGCADPAVTVLVHADNAATVYLNGSKLGEQPKLEIFENFQNPAESYSTSDPALFVCGGTNVLEFDLYNFNNPTAIDYKAVVTYTPIEAQAITFTSAPPDPALLGGTYSASATGGGSGNPVVFNSLTTSICSVIGSSVSLDAVGSCTIAADQAGGPGYSAAPQATQSFDVVWPFGGFTSPVSGAPALNSAKAGQAVPLKFSLGGDRGLAIFASGSPRSVPMACDASAAGGVIDETITAGASTLSYDAVTGLYGYVWKTDKGWAESCRKLVLRLSDGAEYVAYFAFRR